MSLVPRLTGNTRTASIGCTANMKNITNATVPSLGTARFHDKSTAAAWGFSVSVDTVFMSATVEGNTVFPTPPTAVRIAITCKLTVGVGLPDGTSHEYDDIQTFRTAFGPIVGSGQDVFVTETTGNATAGLSGTLELEERTNNALDFATAYIRYENARVWSGSLSASGVMSGACNSGATGPQSYSFSFSVSQSFNGSNAAPNYTHGLGMTAITDIASQVSVSCPGISYSNQGCGGSQGTATLSGTTLSARLQKSNTNTIGFANTQGTPDWQFLFSTENKDYQTGNPIVIGGVPLNLWQGGVLYQTGAGSITTPVLQQAIASVGDGTFDPVTGFANQVKTVNKRTPIFFLSDTASGAILVGVDEAWADGAGRQLTSDQFSGNNKFYEWDHTTDFTAATLTVDDTHRFRWMDDPASWSGTADISGGFFHHTCPGFNQLSLGTFAKPVKFRPWGYRYYKFRVKSSVAGARFDLILQRPVNNIPQFATYTWHFTIPQANVWTELTLDLAFPNDFFDEAFPNTRYVVHPDLTRPQGGFTSTLLDFFTAADFFFDGFTGYHQSANRTPLLLLQGLNTTGSSTDQSIEGHEVIGLQPMDSPDINGGSFWGRLITNGVRGYDFISAQNALGAGWSGLATAVDDVANDTGIHLIPGTNIRNTEVWWSNGHRVDTVPAKVLTPGVPFDIKAVGRRFLFGYYGMGNAVSGGYNTQLSYHADKWWNGEVMGMAWKSSGGVAKAPLTLYDVDDTTTALVSVTSDSDGFFRGLYQKYGVVHTYNNLPTTNESWNLHRKQYTSPDGIVFTYTSIGQRFDHYLLKSKSFRNRDTSSFLTLGTSLPRQKIVIVDKNASWYDLPAKPADGPWLLQTDDGERHVAYASAGNTLYATAPFASAPFTVTGVHATTGTDDSFPRMILDYRGILRLVFVRGGVSSGVYEVFSSDRGLTWSSPTLVIANGDSPIIAVGVHSGEIIRAAVVGANIQGTLQFPGDLSPSAVFTFSDSGGTPLLWEPGAFGLAQGYEGPMRWYLSAVVQGETAPSDWVSGDWGATWTRLT